MTVAAPPWHMTQPVANLDRLLAKTARRWPNRVGLARADERLTWAELDARADRAAAAMRAAGVAPGDRVLVHARNGVAMVEAMWAVFRAGAVFVPTNFRLTPHEVAALAETAAPRLFLCDPASPDHAAAVTRASPLLAAVVTLDESRWAAFRDQGAPPIAPVAVAYGTPAWFFFTSGTTGRSKAAVLTHGQLAFIVNNHVADLFPGLTVDDTDLVVAPLSHAAGLHLLAHTAKGVRSVLTASDSLDPVEVWRLIADERVAVMFTVPTLLNRLVAHPVAATADRRSLRYLLYAGAPMYLADQRRAWDLLGPALVQYYGLGEVTAAITVLPGGDHPAAMARAGEGGIGPCGFARTGVEVAIHDEAGRLLATGEQGEVAVRGPAVFAGYHGDPDANAKAFRDGWFMTGDLGRLDADGALTLTGRASDMFISGGSNVYPREIEELLLQHPDVAEVAVVGMPDPEWGEIGVAVVVAADGRRPEIADLERLLDGRLARYKRPRRWVFWDALPRSGYGKIPKRLIKERLADV
jgi:acyl-CoA synthetase (AMP-forming)/AMP-acid ligase II